MAHACAFVRACVRASARPQRDVKAAGERCGSSDGRLAGLRPHAGHVASAGTSSFPTGAGSAVGLTPGVLLDELLCLGKHGLGAQRDSGL